MNRALHERLNGNNIETEEPEHEAEKDAPGTKAPSDNGAYSGCVVFRGLCADDVVYPLVIRARPCICR